MLRRMLLTFILQLNTEAAFVKNKDDRIASVIYHYRVCSALPGLGLGNEAELQGVPSNFILRPIGNPCVCLLVGIQLTAT